MSKLDGKIVWVTGAGSGIGEAASVALAGEGATVVLTGRRKEPLDAVAARITASGGKAVVEAADLTKAASVDALAQKIVATFGRLDILVNNAGVNILARDWKRIDATGIDTLLQGNLNSAFYCARAVLPAMRVQGGGQLIHTASMAGRNISPLSGPGYTAAKHAVVAMSHTINMEECVNGIRSTVVCPGEVNTPILKQRPNPLSEEELARMLQPEQCGDLIRYLACLPASVTINEVWITPTWNRSYVAALERKPL
ncbi:SDR family oxidoreductase [Bradyrhizobium sp. LHD-71]|uniref:SDR family oxidoreductase n=1 Tax=Bradyrhizobium sp. LHD-71 TaxID=3072141 RepID=UPI00280F9B5C|nr:SDR family oxidoreductase [Bradyrhizobium sp. LHD-71]MDQ8732827.1 SDR family oxidoreductase [Bradyrhizobium sp. LHD-71]